MRRDLGGTSGGDERGRALTVGRRSRSAARLIVSISVSEPSVFSWITPFAPLGEPGVAPGQAVPRGLGRPSIRRLPRPAVTDVLVVVTETLGIPFTTRNGPGPMGMFTSVGETWDAVG